MSMRSSVRGAARGSQRAPSSSSASRNPPASSETDDRNSTEAHAKPAQGLSLLRSTRAVSVKRTLANKPAAPAHETRHTGTVPTVVRKTAESTSRPTAPSSSRATQPAARRTAAHADTRASHETSLVADRSRRLTVSSDGQSSVRSRQAGSRAELGGTSGHGRNRARSEAEDVAADTRRTGMRRAVRETTQGRHAALETRCELLATRVLQWAYLNARQDHAIRLQETRAATQLEAAWRIVDNARGQASKQRTALDLARANQRLHSLLEAATPALEDVGKRAPDLVQSHRQLTTALERTTRHLPLDGVQPLPEEKLAEAIATESSELSVCLDDADALSRAARALSNGALELHTLDQEMRSRIQHDINHDLVATRRLAAQSNSLAAHHLQTRRSTSA